MRALPRGLRAVVAFLLLGLLAACDAEPYPAAEGFDKDGSDTKALELADNVMKRQGGYERWQKVRYLAWTYFGQYHIWDKKLNLYRQEKGNQVVLMSLVKPEGKVFKGGKRVIDPEQTRQSLEQAYLLWRFGSDFLALPFKLKERGVTLRSGGPGVTMAHDTADILEMVYHGTGPAGNSRNQLWISRRDTLVCQWAFYSKPEDQQPAFVRDWLNYRNYNGLLLATQRNSMIDTLTLSHIAVLDTLPRELFFSATPVNKSEVQAWANRKK